MQKKNKQKSCSGKVELTECGKNATLLLDEDWEELVRARGKKAGELYTVSEKNKVISIRVPKERIQEGRELRLRVFLEKVEAKAAGV
jgi:hypothetical protein